MVNSKTGELNGLGGGEVILFRKQLFCSNIGSLLLSVAGFNVVIKTFNLKLKQFFVNY
jgi:hypothetical protein